MRLHTIVVAVVVLTGSLSLAHPTVSAQDVVTGKWGDGGVPYLELKLEAEGKVTGTTYWRDGGELVATAAIDTGRFDAATHAVTLDGTVKHPDAGVVPFHIEGKIDGDVIAGRFRMGDHSGEFSFRKL